MKHINLYLFKIVSIILGLLIAFACLEAGIFILHKLGKIEFLEKDFLTKTAAVSPETKLVENDLVYPLYIPHPYFGYIYRPSSRMLQSDCVIETNSEGFVDNEFPREKEENVIIFGIFGGSSSMSWGVNTRDEKLSTFLENKLNNYAQHMKMRKRFRVLNMGQASHIQYQATQIFNSYQHLLDGAIMYSGHNEISHGNTLKYDRPIEYPAVDFLTTVKIGSAARCKIFVLREEIKNIAVSFANSKVAMLPSIKFYLYRIIKKKLNEIDVLSEKVKEEANQGTTSLSLPLVKGRLRLELPEFNEIKYFFSTVPEDIKNQEKIMRAILPKIFTEPVINAGAIAQKKGIDFLFVIQPMFPLCRKDFLTPEEKNIIPRNPVFKANNIPPICQYIHTGHNILIEETAKIASYGFKTMDLNEEGLFADVKETAFLDTMHLKALGNEIVARRLFDFIKDNWLKDKNKYF